MTLKHNECRVQRASFHIHNLTILKCLLLSIAEDGEFSVPEKKNVNPRSMEIWRKYTIQILKS